MFTVTRVPPAYARTLSRQSSVRTSLQSQSLISGVFASPIEVNQSHNSRYSNINGNDDDDDVDNNDDIIKI